MKDMTLSAVGVLLLALGIGLVFQWFYPLVTMTSDLALLFVFSAVVLKLVFSRLSSWLRKSPSSPPPSRETEMKK